MKILTLLKTGIRGAWYYVWGHFFACLYYDKKYLKGKWFSGKLNGLCSKGWEWVTLDGFSRMVHKTNTTARFPVTSRMLIASGENIDFHPDDLNNFQTCGCYFQAIGKITIGHGTYIAPNVGLITANHDFTNLDNHLPPKSIVLGENCWIGMNSVILPGVELGNNTVVGAGSVVTKSFPDGRCVIAGNPAKIIKTLD